MITAEDAKRYRRCMAPDILNNNTDGLWNTKGRHMYLIEFTSTKM